MKIKNEVVYYRFPPTIHVVDMFPSTYVISRHAETVCLLTIFNIYDTQK